MQLYACEFLYEGVRKLKSCRKEVIYKYNISIGGYLKARELMVILMCVDEGVLYVNIDRRRHLSVSCSSCVNLFCWFC